MAAVVGWAAAVVVLFSVSAAREVLPLGKSAWTLTLAAASAAAFWCTGWRLYALLWSSEHPGEDPLERTLLELGLGIGAAMLAILLLGLLGLFSPTWGVVLLAGCAVAGGDPRARFVELRRRAQCYRGRGRGGAFWWSVLALVALMTGLHALTPAYSQDAFVYHLALPDVYIRHGGIHHIAGNFFASFPQNAEMLFTLGLLIDDASLAKVYHWMTAALAVATVASLARRVGGGRGGLVAATVFATIPSVALISSWAYVDLTLIYFQLLAVLALLRWWRDETPRWLVLSGIFCGLAAGCKYTGGIVAVLGCFGLVLAALARRQPPRDLARNIAWISAATLAVVAPWYVKNLVFTGNPIHPFLYGVFGGRDWDAERAATLAVFFKNFGGDLTPWTLFKLPWTLTFEAQFSNLQNSREVMGLDGVIGPVFLICAPVLFVALRRERPLQFLAISVVFLGVTWLAMTRQIRFLLPALAIFSSLIGAIACEARGAGWRRPLQAAIGIAMIVNVAFIGLRFAAHNPLPVVFGLESEDRFLAREIAGGDYAVFKFIENRLSADARVFMAAAGNPGFLCRRDYYMDAVFGNHTLRQILSREAAPRDVLEEFRERGFTHFLFRWDLVFDATGRRSGLERPQQLLLAEFLNRHARLLISRNGTFLYEVAEGIGNGAGRPATGGGSTP